MEERPAYPWTLTEIAQALHVAPGYLVRLFKAATGVHLPGAFHPRGPTVSDPVTVVLPEDPPTPIWYVPRAVAQPPREVS